MSQASHLAFPPTPHGLCECLLHDSRVVVVGIGHDLGLLCYSFFCQSLGEVDNGVVGIRAIYTTFVRYEINSSTQNYA